MLTSTICPVRDRNGAMCSQEPHPASSAGLCVSHWESIVRDWVAEKPRVRMRCMSCDRLQECDSVDVPTLRCESCNADMSLPTVAPIEPFATPVESRTFKNLEVTRGYVYYLRFGDRYKIGFSTDVQRRIAAIPHDELLAVEPGTYELERKRHATFAESRVDGQREWFHASAHLLHHIATVEDRYGLLSGRTRVRQASQVGAQDE